MVSITRNFGPVPNFEGVRIGPFDSMVLNGVTIESGVSVNAEGSPPASIEMHTHSNSSAGGIFYGAKSRGTVASPAIVQDADELYGIWAVGFDGTDYAVGAFIKFHVDGTPGSNDMPTRIVFSTSADGSQSPTERLRIASDGLITVSNGVITCPHTGTNSERFGDTSEASSDNCTAFGNNSAAYGPNATAFGYMAYADNTTGGAVGSVAIGTSAFSDAGVAIGFAASVTASGVAIGLNAASTGAFATVIGGNASGAGSSTVNIGANSVSASGTSGIGIGNNTNIGSGSARVVLIGVDAAASGGADDVIAIGTAAASAFSDTISLGSGAIPTATGQCLIGGQAGATNVCPITTLIVGRGPRQASPDATVTFTTTSATTGGTNNVSGSAILLQGGTGVGNSTGGYVAIRTTAPGSSGNSAQTQVERVRFKVGTEVVFNDGAADYDHRIESVNDPNVVAVDASTDSVGFGVAPASHTGKVHIQQISTTGAKPVLTLQQKDLSEEFLRLIGESADDNSQSLVDAANLATPGTVAGWFKVYVQDDKASGAITDGVYYVPFYTTPT